jgi:hypothetical protein
MEAVLRLVARSSDQTIDREYRAGCRPPARDRRRSGNSWWWKAGHRSASRRFRRFGVPVGIPVEHLRGRGCAPSIDLGCRNFVVHRDPPGMLARSCRGSRPLATPGTGHAFSLELIVLRTRDPTIRSKTRRLRSWTSSEAARHRFLPWISPQEGVFKRSSQISGKSRDAAR